MPRGVLWAVALGLAGAPEGLAATLAEELGDALRAPALAEAEVGVCVLSWPDGRERFARGADRALVPASTMKLVTTALTVLDLEHPPALATRLLVRPRGEAGPARRGALQRAPTEPTEAPGSDGSPGDSPSPPPSSPQSAAAPPGVPLTADGTLDGDLVLEGRGDPNLSGRFHDGDAQAPLRALLGEARARTPFGRIAGDLILDATSFEALQHHPNWAAADRRAYYGAPVAALSLNDNCVDVTVRPGAAPGAPAAVTARPACFPLDNRCTTTAIAAEHVVSIDLVGGTLRIGGRILRGSAGLSKSVPVDDAVRFTGRVFARLLSEAGVELAGTVRVRAPDEVLGPTTLLAERAGPLAATLAVTNKRSQNFYAEMLFKALSRRPGAPGGWAASAAAARARLEAALGPLGAGVVIDDGSGLSRANRLTAGLLTRVLAQVAGEARAAPLFFDSLSVAGLDGTLAGRLAEWPAAGTVLGKTGSLTGVDALAGVIGPGEQPAFVFAFLVNGARRGHGETRAALDALALILARHARAEAARAAAAAHPGAPGDAPDGDAFRAWALARPEPGLALLFAAEGRPPAQVRAARRADLAADLCHARHWHLAERRYTRLALRWQGAGAPLPEWAENLTRLRGEDALDPEGP